MPNAARVLSSPYRTPEQMEWIHDHFKIDGLGRLARANRDYADDHGCYLPDVAALAHAALMEVERLREQVNSGRAGREALEGLPEGTLPRV